MVAARNESTPTRTSDGSFVPQVLLIDDNLSQLRMRESLLREACFSVLTSSTAEQALEFLRPSAAGPDIIITDPVLPGASGSVFVNGLAGLPARPCHCHQRDGGCGERVSRAERSVFGKPCWPESLIRKV